MTQVKSAVTNIVLFIWETIGEQKDCRATQYDTLAPGRGRSPPPDAQLLAVGLGSET